MPYDANKGYYCDSSFPADTRPDDFPAEYEEPEVEEEPDSLDTIERPEINAEGPLDSLDALEANLADTRGLPTLDEEIARLKASGHEEEATDLGHADCEVCDEVRAIQAEVNRGRIEGLIAEMGEPIVWVSLKAQLEIAEAVARERKNLELRVAELTEALEEIKRIAGANDLNHVSRHIATLANLALNNRAEVRRAK